MVEYQNKKSSGLSKVAATLGGTALGLNLLGIGNGGGLLGGIAPAYRGGFGGGYAAGFAQPIVFGDHGSHGGYVTEKEMCLIRESSGKDAVIAQLSAEKYSDAALREYDRTEVEPLKTRVCNIETALAVNAARDQDFRHYVNREFVHQPKATMNEMIVTCKPCGCNHDHGCDCSC